MNFSRDEINCLIYCYLKEANYNHSAYAFYNESKVSDSINVNVTPANALKSILQYTVNNTECVNESDCSGLQIMEAANILIKPDREANHCYTEQTLPISVPPNLQLIARKPIIQIPKGKALLLPAHSCDVFICGWNPKNDILATAAGDGRAILWDLNDNVYNDRETILPHIVYSNGVEQLSTKDITTLHWNPDGTQLVTGSYDSFARIWDPRNGRIRFTLARHTAPIYNVKYNSKGNYILTGGADKRAIIWDAYTGEVIQEFNCHQKSVMNIDWESDESFASCSHHTVYVSKLGHAAPIASFNGHTGEVNIIRWDPQCQMLASGSDDTTIKVWTVNNPFPLFNLTGQKGQIYHLSWSPTGPGTQYPSMNLYLATCSFDSTVRLWEMGQGTLIHEFTQHKLMASAAVFSPDAKYLCTGSYDTWIYIWNTLSHQLIYSYQTGSGILEVCWSSCGTKVAASCSSGAVYILDLRKV